MLSRTDAWVLVGVAGGRRDIRFPAPVFGIVILGNAREETDAFGGDPERMAFGVDGVIGMNGVIGVIGVIGVTGVIGGMLPSEKEAC